jgi:hypothetical protein
MPVNERTALLDAHAQNFWSFGDGSGGGGPENREDFHAQFCRLVGILPSDLPPDEEPPPIGPKTLYGRALKMRRDQSTTYTVTAGISNTLLLAQVVLGAAVTALGASASSHILITLFGASNTIIAGVVAYLKSRGQPMRARMYRDDLERVVDEIENSEIMWLGISKNMHGYSDINTDDEVTVRSEVARLTRLYDRAIRTNSLNNPDMYMPGSGSDNTSSALRKGTLPSGPVLPPVVTPGPTTAPVVAPDVVLTPVVADPDESPASAPPKPPPKPELQKEDKTDIEGEGSKTSGKAPAADSAAPKDEASKEADGPAGSSDDSDLLLHHEPADAADGKMK